MAQLVTDSAPVAARGAECGLWSGEYWAQQVSLPRRRGRGRKVHHAALAICS
jgi:hypothetical protein